MADKRSALLGKLYVFLMVFYSIMLFKVNWKTQYLFVNVGIIIVALIVFNRIRQEDVSLLIVALAWMVITLPITDGGLGSVLSFFATTALMIVYSSIYVEEKIQKLLCVVCLVGSVLMYQQSLDFGENYKRAILFKINPNTISAISLYCFLFMGTFTDLRKKKSKFLFAFCTVLALITVLNCRGRGAMMAMIAFFVLLLIPQRLWSAKGVMQLLTTIVVLGTSIPIIYVLIYQRGYELQIMGKPLFSGREEIWAEMFRQFGQSGLSILVGLGSKAQLWEHNLNVHNNFFNIIVNFGVVGYFLYFYVIFRYVRSAAEGIKDLKVRKGLITFFCAALILGFVESTTLNNSLAPFSYFGLVYANGKIRNDRRLQQIIDSVA